MKSRLLPALVFAGSAQLGVAQPVAPAVPLPAPAEPPAATAVPATAFGQPAPTPSPTPAADFNQRISLRRLIAADAPMVLRTASAIYTVFLPKSARMDMKTCRMHLEFTNSIALLSERSVLRVVLNEVILAQFYLERDNPKRVVEFDVPVALLEDGFNRLQFIAAQHYTYKCEDPSAPELYTEINPDRSYLTATGTWKPVPTRLSFLRWWIDEKLWVPYEFNVVMPGARPMTDLHLALGSIATQGIALAVNNQPFVVRVSNGLRAGMDNFVVGTMNELSVYLTATEVGAINGGFLAIRPMPGDPTRCMVIISGRNEQEVTQTAVAFGLVNFPLPDSQFATIDRMNLPATPPFVRNAPLDLPGIYGFDQLRYRTRTIKGWNTGGYFLEVYMPGDISRDDTSNAELRLNFAYGAAMRKDSTFNVFVNGIFQTTIRLDNQRGAIHNGHRLFLPMKAFQPGRNSLDLVPAMVPLYSDQCQILQDENLLFTLYDDSEFVFPRALRRARLPSLGLFSQTAYPYISVPDGFEAAVCVAGRDEETVCATWTILGKMAQVSGALLSRAEIGFKLPRSRKSLLVVGPRDQLPAEVFEKAPISPLETGRIRYVVSAIPQPVKVATTPVDEFLQKLRGQPTTRGEPQPPAVAELNLTADLVEETVAVQFESPFNAGYPVTVITAGDSRRLMEGAYALLDRRVWDNLRGDLAIWSLREKSLAVAKVGPDFIFRATSLVTRVGTRLDANPWLMAVIVIAVLAVLGGMAALYLRKRERQEEEHGSG